MAPEGEEVLVKGKLFEYSILKCVTAGGDADFLKLLVKGDLSFMGREAKMGNLQRKKVNPNIITLSF